MSDLRQIIKELKRQQEQHVASEEPPAGYGKHAGDIEFGSRCAFGEAVKILEGLVQELEKEAGRVDIPDCQTQMLRRVIGTAS